MLRTLCICAVLWLWAPGVLAEEVPQANGGEAIRLFLDCQRGCDGTYLRRELTFVSFVRDPADSDVHLLITRQSSASGSEYLLSFLGQGSFEGFGQALRYNSSNAQTDHERRVGMLRLIKLGLVPYVVQSPYADGLNVVWTAPAAAEVAVRPGSTAGKDPWNYWVYTTEFGTELKAQERREDDQIWGSMWASRTTEAWRMGYGMDHRFRQRDFEFEDGSTFEDISRSSGIYGFAIKSFGEHWGVGGGLRARSSTFRNLERGYRVAGALEYNVFPYSESSLRALTTGYFVGAMRLNYEEPTVFGVLTEDRANHGAWIDYTVKQPWGDASVELEVEQFLEDTDLYRVELSGELDYRLTRGLTVRLWADAALVRDQIYLPASGLSDEDVLLGRRALDTGFETRIGLSLRYRFGSIYNSAVNVRLRNRGFTNIF